MAKVKYIGDNRDGVKNQGVFFPEGEAVEVSDGLAAKLFWNPKFEVKGLPKEAQPPKPEAPSAYEGTDIDSDGNVS